MSKSGWILAVSGGVLIAGVGLGGVAHVATRAPSAHLPASAPLVAFVPDEASIVGHVDLQALAESPLSDLLMDGAQADDARDPFAVLREELQIDPETELETATFSAADAGATPGSAPPSRWGVALRGTFDPARLVERLESRPSVRKEEYAGTTLFHVDAIQPAPGSGSVALAVHESGSLLIGPPDYLKGMIDAGGESASNDGPVSEWLDSLAAGDTFWIAGTPPSGIGKLAESSPAGKLPAVSSFLLSGRLSDSMALVARARAESAAGAQNLIDLLQGFIAIGKLSDAMSPQIRSVLDSLRVDRAEDRISLSVDVPYDTLKQLIEQQRSAPARR